MPLEIKEIVVTASVTESFLDKNSKNSPAGGAGNNEDLIAQCVEQVMEILREKNER